MTNISLGLPRITEMTHPFFRQAYSEVEIEKALANAGLVFEKLEDNELLAKVARDLADQKIVGWFQSRYEIGPRALGNRSILADPRSLQIKDIINSRIKARELFQPFEPAVLFERAHEYFEIDQHDPFMMAPRVRPGKIADIPAAVHVSRHEPIVASPAEAVSCYLRTEMDRLALGNYYIARRNGDAEERTSANLEKVHSMA